MLYPSIDKLIERFDSKYTIVAACAKRARQLQDGVTPALSEPKSDKYVGMALEEIAEGKIEIVTPERHEKK